MGSQGILTKQFDLSQETLTKMLLQGIREEIQRENRKEK
jgi:hypothetical protein